MNAWGNSWGTSWGSSWGQAPDTDADGFIFFPAEVPVAKKTDDDTIVVMLAALMDEV